MAQEALYRCLSELFHMRAVPTKCKWHRVKICEGIQVHGENSL